MVGRRVLGGVIVAAAVVGIIGALEWREVAIRWELAKLEGQDAETELPFDFVSAEPATIKGDALERYVSTPHGKERLLRYYLAVVEESRPRRPKLGIDVGEGGKTAILLLWMGAHPTAMRAAVSEPLAFGPLKLRRKLQPTFVMRHDLRMEKLGIFAPRLQDLVLRVGYDGHPVPDRPGARFSVVSCAGAENPRNRHFAWNFPWGSYACLIESDPYRLDPLP